MKCADIRDRHVIDLAARWQAAPLTTPGVVAALIAAGVPRKLAAAKVDRLERRGLLESGVSSNYAWPTADGLALLHQPGCSCDIHGPNCEAPGDLCCGDCTEARHPFHPTGVACTWASDADLAFAQNLARLSRHARPH